jgi:protocatechuate 3,4-dioxygenase alpha subunit
VRFPTTPPQTVGPFFHFGLDRDDGPRVVPAGSPRGVWLRGVLLDGAGDPVPDGLVETWQADGNGRLAASASCRGFGRSTTDGEGRFGVFTVKPGRVPHSLDPGHAALGGSRARLQAPHIDVAVFARGLLHRVVTRVYFADEASANAEDALFGALPVERRSTLLAQPAADGYRFDIRLQGDRETIFFSL